MSDKAFDLSRRNLFKGTAAAGAGIVASGALGTPALAEAPLLGPERPSYYRFDLGEFEVTTPSGRRHSA